MSLDTRWSWVQLAFWVPELSWEISEFIWRGLEICMNLVYIIHAQYSNWYRWEIVVFVLNSEEWHKIYILGVLYNGRVRCPWHGACFDVATGDIEDYPGLDSLPKFNVSHFSLCSWHLFIQVCGSLFCIRNFFEWH